MPSPVALVMAAPLTVRLPWLAVMPLPPVLLMVPPVTETGVDEAEIASLLLWSSVVLFSTSPKPATRAGLVVAPLLM